MNKMGLGLVVTIISLLMAATQAFGTTAIAFRSQHRLILASDSKAIGDKTNTVECKIFGFGTLYFTISGIPYDRHTGYEVARIVREGISTPGGFSERVQATALLLKNALAQEMTRLKLDDPRLYAWVLKDGGDLLQLALAQYENGKPLLAVLAFHFDGDSDFKVTQHNCPGDCGEEAHVYYLGYHDVIDEFVKANKVGVQDLANLIDLEIKAHPDEVGVPINVLQITPEARTWLLGGESCKLE